MKRFAPVFVTVVAGCQPMAASTPQQPVQPAPITGCPAAGQVYVASYLTRDDHAAAADPGGGHTGWVLPLHDRKVESTANQPEYMTIDPVAAQRLEIPAAPASAWMLLPNQPACRATVGSYYAAAVDSADANITYGVELTGCAAPPQDQQQDAEAIVLVAEQAPTACEVVTPQAVASRLGELDAAKHWQRPTKQTPIPPGLAAAIPPHECTPPGCEMLWAIAEVDVANQPVAWAGAVNWLTIPPNTTAASQCDWKTETFAGFFIAGPDGNAVKITEGQDHPMLLSAVLADQTGARVLIAEGPGAYATFDLAAGRATLARHLVWLRLGRDAYVLDERIGPSCESGDDRH